MFFRLVTQFVYMYRMNSLPLHCKNEFLLNKLQSQLWSLIPQHQSLWKVRWNITVIIYVSKQLLLQQSFYQFTQGSFQFYDLNQKNVLSSIYCKKF